MGDGRRLTDLVKHLKKMAREGEPSKKLDRFYEERVFPASIPVVVSESRSAFKNREYELEILTLGETPYPLIHSILTLQPKRVLLIHTSETADKCEVVEADVKQHAAQVDASVPTFEKQQVNRVRGEEVYEAIREAMGDNGTRIAVDITGGTKAMVGGAAQAAALLGADVVYVEAPPLEVEESIPGEAERKKKKRIYKVHPGRERVHLLENPYRVFGDVDEQRALDLFKQHRYLAAADILNRIARNVLGTAGDRYRLEYYLASGYGYAEAMDFAGAADALGQTHTLARQLRRRNDCPNWLDGDCLRIIDGQRAAARCLADKLPDTAGQSALPLLQAPEAFQALWSFIYNYALRRADVGQYDMAALAMYRCLELIPQRRLATYGEGVRTDEPNYKKLVNNTKVFEDVTELARAFQAWPERPPTTGTSDCQLPKHLTCKNGLRLLLTIDDDPLARELGCREQQKKLLQRTEECIQARNKSILAHGVARISREQYQELKEVVEAWAQALCAAEEGWDWEELQTAFRFVKLEG